MFNHIKEKKVNLDFRYIFFFAILLAAVFIFYGTGIWSEQIYNFFKLAEWSTYHIILEFISSFICFIVFSITYYTYAKENRIRRLIYFNIFFIVGCLNFIHMITYMRTFYLLKDSLLAEAENIWLLSRFILAVGMLCCGLVYYKKTIKGNRNYFLLGSIGLVCLISYFSIYKTYSFHFSFAPFNQSKAFLEYIVAILFGAVSILYLKDYHLTREKSFLKIAAGAALSVFAEIAFILRSGECCSYNFIGHTYRLLGLFLIFRGIFVFNLDHPYAQADKARNQLKLYAENLEKVIEKRTFEIKRANQKMLEDLEYAKRIQETLLPPTEINIHDAKFVSGYIPCESLSGDFYQIHPIDDDFIGMYIADVSGHGVSAAMMTVFADRAMTPVYEQGKQGRKLSPAKTLLQFYKKFNEWNFPSDMYIVIFKAIYHKRSRILSYCSGGINVEPILVRAGGEVEILNQSKGFPICKFGDFYTPEFTNAEVELEKGDRVIFYTDGLAESFKENALMERTELIRLLQENKNANLHALNQAILRKIFKEPNKMKYDDDITYFIMEA